MTPLTGWPDDVLPDLTDIVDELVDDEDVEEFYIGRGVDLDERRTSHGSDDIIALYESDSLENVMSVEEDLIKEFIDHDKCNNEADHAGGGVSDVPPFFVYVALWSVDEGDAD